MDNNQCLIKFAKATLDWLESGEDWGADTLQEIAASAEALDLSEQEPRKPLARGRWVLNLCR